jgi:hypothetical protein
MHDFDPLQDDVTVSSEDSSRVSFSDLLERRSGQWKAWRENPSVAYLERCVYLMVKVSVSKAKCRGRLLYNKYRTSAPMVQA